MPVMPRVKNKITKIAFKILGTLPNDVSSKQPAQKKRDNRFISEQTSRVR